MQRLYRLAEGYRRRFPQGDEPYQILARLLEECGEVAREVNHWEGSGVKRTKHGEPSRERLAAEIKQVLAGAIGLASYYGIEDELERSIGDSLARMQSEGLIPG